MDLAFFIAIFLHFMYTLADSYVVPLRSMCCCPVGRRKPHNLRIAVATASLIPHDLGPKEKFLSVVPSVPGGAVASSPTQELRNAEAFGPRVSSF